ncbi:unnamed protein product, partial [Effrenium voratum]
ALRLRHEAQCARERGWPALRALWGRCMSLRRGQVPSRLAHLDSSREKYSRRKSQVQIHRRIQRLVVRLERRLAATARCKRPSSCKTVDPAEPSDEKEPVRKAQRQSTYSHGFR